MTRQGKICKKGSSILPSKLRHSPTSVRTYGLHDLSHPTCQTEDEVASGVVFDTLQSTSRRSHGHLTSHQGSSALIYSLVDKSRQPVYWQTFPTTEAHCSSHDRRKSNMLGCPLQHSTNSRHLVTTGEKPTHKPLEAAHDHQGFSRISETVYWHSRSSYHGQYYGPPLYKQARRSAFSIPALSHSTVVGVVLRLSHIPGCRVYFYSREPLSRPPLQTSTLHP